jgi:hypothetical protein
MELPKAKPKTQTGWRGHVWHTDCTGILTYPPMFYVTLFLWKTGMLCPGNLSQLVNLLERRCHPLIDVGLQTLHILLRHGAERR